jgi:transcriptional regulator of acetoin/glycerol metabolism
MAVVSRADEIRPEDLPPEICAGTAPTRPEAETAGSLADVERAHILRVLARTGGNKSQAAELLGIDRSTLHAKLKQYGIDRGA